MARLIGYMANRTDQLAETLKSEELAVGPASDIEADAWGLGFYQGGEVLHKKRPRGEDTELQWSDVAGSVTTDCAIVHFRKATVGDFRSENTHPFRMRQWLFAHNGTVHGFDAIREPLLDAIPDFLRRGIRGTTDSEHLFSALLSFLHDAGQLDSPEPEERVVVAAMRSTVSLVDRLAAEIGAPPATLDFVVTDGRRMFAHHRGAAMAYTERTVEPEDGRSGSSLRYVLIASNGKADIADWKTVEPGAILVVDRSLDVRVA